MQQIPTAVAGGLHLLLTQVARIKDPWPGPAYTSNLRRSGVRVPYGSGMPTWQCPSPVVRRVAPLTPPPGWRRVILPLALTLPCCLYCVVFCLVCAFWCVRHFASCPWPSSVYMCLALFFMCSLFVASLCLLVFLLWVLLPPLVRSSVLPFFLFLRLGACLPFLFLLRSPCLASPNCPSRCHCPSCHL